MRRVVWLVLALSSVTTPSVAAGIRAELYVSGLSSPLAFVPDPLDQARHFIVEQGGRIRAVRNGGLESSDFLDLTTAVLSGGERGLLGLAFAPDHATSRRFYVNFTNLQGHTVVARFRRMPGVNGVADPTSRFDLRWPSGERFIQQPFGNHNGGTLAFGPDGYLYIGLGDGGSSNDPGHRAQDPATLLGKMLRIDVGVPDGDAEGYDVPPDNPFAGGAGPVAALAEIWAFGLRNPWKFSFDDRGPGATGALIIADVGQSSWEEIDYEPAGAGGRNYGWRNREGAHDHVTTLPPAYTPLIDPVFEYSHAEGNSITGGFVYRGALLDPANLGRYFFADFGAGRVWSLGLDVDPVTGEATAGSLLEHTTELGGAAALGLISSLGVDLDGELYVVSWDRGEVIRVLPDLPGPFGKTTPANGAAGLATGVTLSWGASGGAASYEYCLDASNNDACDTGWTSVGSSTSATVSSLSAGEIYSWQVRAVNAGGMTTADAGAWWTFTTSYQPALRTRGDLDGDRKADMAVFRPAEGAWYLLRSGAGAVGLLWGEAGDVPVASDYDGDDVTDVAVFRPSTGAWFVARSSGGATGQAWGADGDVAAPADFDGDGITDLAVFRPTEGAWYIARSSGGAIGVVWGANGDMPAPADYDGDGVADIAVFRPSEGSWYIARSGGGAAGLAWGAAGDVPVPADYDGDGRADVAVFRPGEGAWYIAHSSGGATAISWGGAGDQLVAGDYDGDGRSDVAVFRESDGGWYIAHSTGGAVGIAWGTAGDVAVPLR